MYLTPTKLYGLNADWPSTRVLAPNTDEGRIVLTAWKIPMKLDQE